MAAIPLVLILPAIASYLSHMSPAFSWFLGRTAVLIVFRFPYLLDISVLFSPKNSWVFCPLSRCTSFALTLYFARFYCLPHSSSLYWPGHRLHSSPPGGPPPSFGDLPRTISFVSQFNPLHYILHLSPSFPLNVGPEQNPNLSSFAFRFPLVGPELLSIKICCLVQLSHSQVNDPPTLSLF